MKIARKYNGPTSHPATLVLLVMLILWPVVGSATFFLSAARIQTTSFQNASSHMVYQTTPGTDFSLSAYPSFSLIQSGPSSQGVSNVTVSSEGGFVGTVSLTASVTLIGLPPFQGYTASFRTPNLNLAGNGTNSTILSFNAYGARNFLVNVTGTSGTLAHSTLIVFQSVTFFFHMSQSNPKPILPGSSISADLVVQGQNDFAGVVTFTITITPSNRLAWTISPETVTGSGYSVLTLTAQPDASGTYTVDVVARSGGLTSEASISVSIGNPVPYQFPSIDALPFGLPGTVIALSLWSLFVVCSSLLIWQHRRKATTESSVEKATP